MGILPQFLKVWWNNDVENTSTFDNDFVNVHLLADIFMIFIK